MATYCHETGKRVYFSGNSAREKVERSQPNKGRRRLRQTRDRQKPYRCEHCGYYHLASL